MEGIKRAWFWVCKPPTPLMLTLFILGIAFGGSLHSVEFRWAQACIEQGGGQRQFDCTWGDFIERWQELIGSLIALGAASIAAVPLYQQLREMNRQSQSIAVERLTRIVQSLEQERKESRSSSSNILAYMRQIGRKVPDIKSGDIDELNAEVLKLLNATDKHASRNPQVDDMTAQRRDLLNSTINVRVVLSNLRTIIRKLKIHPLSRVDESNIDLVELRNTLRVWYSSQRNYDVRLAGEVERYWLRIRKLEQIAIGGSDD